MLVTLSSKGQLIIPKSVREALALKPGDKLLLQMTDHKIILEPVDVLAVIDELDGMFAGEDLIGDLEREHREELEREQLLYP